MVTQPGLEPSTGTDARRAGRAPVPGPGRQRRAGHPGQARSGAPRPRLPARLRPPPDRGRPRRRQDVARQGDRPVDRRHLAPGPVHPRPPPVRRHRRLGVEPAHRGVRVPARRVFANVVLADEINRASPKTAVGAARGDGGTPGDRRRGHLPARRARSWSSRPRTRSSSRAPIPCPRRSSTASSCASRWATRTARLRRSRSSRSVVEPPRGRGARRSRGKTRSPRLQRRSDDHVAAPLLAGSSTWPAQTQRHRRPRARGQPRGALALQRRARALAASCDRIYVMPDDVKRVAPVVLDTASSDPGRGLRELVPADVLGDVLASVPVPRATGLNGA